MTFRSAVGHELEDRFYARRVAQMYRTPSTGMAVEILAPILLDRGRFNRLIAQVMLPPADNPGARITDLGSGGLVEGTSYDRYESPIMLAIGQGEALFALIGGYPGPPDHPDEIDGIENQAIAAAWSAPKYAKTTGRRWTNLPEGIRRSVIGLTWDRANVDDGQPRLIDPLTAPRGPAPG